MEEYVNRFLQYLRTERNYSDYTEQNYLFDVEDFSNYLYENHLSFKKITYKEIMVYVKYLKEKEKLKSTSINRHLSSLRSFYNYLLRENVIKANPFSLVNGPKNEKKLPNYMKYSEFEMLVETCDETPLGIRNRALLELLLATGARIGEIIAIRISDIQFSTREIKVLGKGNKERICYFNEYCEKALLRYIENARPLLLKNKTSNRLFINHLGGDLTDRGVRDILDKILHKCTLKNKVTPHTFRHTFAAAIRSSSF